MSKIEKTLYKMVDGVMIPCDIQQVDEDELKSKLSVNSMESAKLKELKERKVMRRYTDAFEETLIGDIELGLHLNKKDPKWTWQKIGEYNLYLCNDQVEAIVKFNNSECTKKVWLRK